MRGVAQWWHITDEWSHAFAECADADHRFITLIRFHFLGE